VRDEQKPDLNGSKVPAGATDGSVVWIRLDNVPVMGRMVALQRHRGIASSYQCGLCDCPGHGTSNTLVPLVVLPLTPVIDIGSAQSFTATAVYRDCYSNGFPGSATSRSTWRSYDTSVATMSLWTATGRGPGSTTIEAKLNGCVWTPPVPPYYLCSCVPLPSIYGYATLTVRPPSVSLTRQSLTSTSATGSPSSQAGNPAFTYSAAGSGKIATYTTQNANANPNTASINAPANPGGVPTPGGLATLTATYHVTTGATAAKSFQSPTFGLSCYIVALENDWINPDATCKPVTIDPYPPYTGYSTNPTGLPPGQYCNSFLGMVRLNGSGQTRNGTKIHWESGNFPDWVFSVISQFTGSDGTPIIANQTLARDRSIIPKTTPSTNVQLPGGSYAANDTGSPSRISGYRLDIYKGVGNAACSGFVNNIVVGACSPAVSTCPAYTIP